MSQIVLPNVINNMIICYLRYADYSDEDVRKHFSPNTVMLWRKSSNVKNGFANCVRHSVDDIPSINKDNGRHQEWYKNGERHRNGDLPAYIHYDYIGDCDIKEWYRDGKQYYDNINRPICIRKIFFKDEKGWCDGREEHRYKDGKVVINRVRLDE